jgi:hypothetical protein
MTPTSLPPDRFEERLLANLKQVVADQPAPAEEIKNTRPGFSLSPRGYRLAGAGAGLALAAVGVVLVTGGDSSTPAYAVQTSADGKVSVEIKSFRDAGGLEKKLTAAGVPAVVNYLPLGKTCAPGMYTAAKDQSRGSSQIMGGTGVPGDKEAITFTIDRAEIPKDATLVIETSGGDPVAAMPKQGVTGVIGGTRLAYAQGHVGTCNPVDAPEPTGPPQVKRSAGDGKAVSPGPSHAAPGLTQGGQQGSDVR